MSGKVIYRFYVYIITEKFIGKKDPLTTDEMEHVVDLEFDKKLHNNPLTRDLLSDALNGHLPRFLKNHGLLKFIPYGKPTLEKHEDRSYSICYYHNQIAHDQVFEFFPKYIMAGCFVEIELRSIYNLYGLEGWFDDRTEVEGYEQILDDLEKSQPKFDVEGYKQMLDDLEKSQQSKEPSIILEEILNNLKI